VGICRKETNLLLLCDLSITMRCIQFQTPLAPLHSHLKPKHPPRTSQLLWLSTINEPTELILHRPNNLPQMAPRPKALPSFVVLGASSAAKAGGDISVLLPTGLVLFHPNALNLLNEAVGRYCISKAIVHSFFFFFFHLSVQHFSFCTS
jgi:hypothetical protein